MTKNPTVGNIKIKPIKDMLHINEDSSKDKTVSTDYVKFLHRQKLKIILCNTELKQSHRTLNSVVLQPGNFLADNWNPDGVYLFHQYNIYHNHKEYYTHAVYKQSPGSMY
jgi:hypothetical protein